jgi:thiol-disulfide isomerase/thioredoxin
MDTSQAMKASALDLSVSQWFNAKNAITLEQLRGRIIVIGAFQMLCPTCVSQSIPQLIKLHQAFPEDRLIVIGLHTVFEHHQAMQSHALEAFIHEYRIRFPVGVDAHERDDPVPRTMRSLQFRGTPSTIVLDAAGDIRLHRFGHVDDFSLGSRSVSCCNPRRYRRVARARASVERCNPNATSTLARLRTLDAYNLVSAFPCCIVIK